MFGLHPLSAAAFSALTGQERSASVSEQATASEAEFVAASTFLASLSEALRVIDAASSVVALSANIAESTTAADSVASSATFPAQITEAGAISDETSAVAAFTGQIEELSTAQDTTAVAASVFGASIAEVAFGLDNFNPAGSIYNVSVQFGVTVFDEVIGAYLWNPIPDDQNPNWGPVNNTQTVTWAAIDDSQTPNWQNVANAQGSGWTPVNTDDDPNWQPAIEP